MPEQAARVSDKHTCPKVEVFPQGDGTSVTVLHVGGPIVAGSPDVRIAGQSAATLGSVCRCTGGGPYAITQPVGVITTGSATVMINGKRAARRGDHTAHGGVIAEGEPTVIIGG
jgi:uncharacterized Zn-binding protein involved in type VI secretion